MMNTKQLFSGLARKSFRLMTLLLCVSLLAGVSVWHMKAKEHSQEPPVGNMTVFGENIEHFQIIHAKDAAPAIVYAAEELRGYINTATGVALKVSDDSAPAGTHEILIGETNRDRDSVIVKRQALNSEGYMLYAEEGRLYISGASERGTLYGVYSFLEDQVGWRFYTAGFERVIPQPRVDITNDLDFSFNPPFEYRDSFWFGAFDAAFSAKQKINSRNNLDDYGGGVRYASPGVHTIRLLAGYSDTSLGASQPCLTDEKIYQKVLANVRKWLDEQPEADIISVSQNDSMPYQKGHQCKNCKALNEAHGSEMGSLLTFVNRIAGDIKEDYPDVKVSTLAYLYSQKPPVNLEPADNVIIRLCSIKNCFSVPFTETGHPDTQAFVNDIKQWADISDTLYIWNYNTSFASYNTPFPNFETMWANMRFFREINVDGVLEQGNYQSPNGEFAELRAYLAAKLLWNPDMTREAYYDYMDDFLEGYYGAGWRHVRAFIDSTAQIAAQAGCMVINQEPLSVLGFKRGREDDLSRIDALLSLFEQAYDEAEDGIHKNHVEKSSIQMRLLKLIFLGARNQTEAYTDLYRLMASHGITHINEGLPLTEAHLKGF